MTALISKPWTVDLRAERVYAYTPREVCIDLTNGTNEDRARVLALLEQVQRMASLLRGSAVAACEVSGDGRLACHRLGTPYESQCRPCQARTVLRDAGVPCVS